MEQRELLCTPHLADVGEREHRTADGVIFRPIERDSEVVPAARFVADFPVNRREGVEHLLHHSRQVDILQPMGDVLDGASDVSFNQIDDFGGDRREPLDALFEVEKDGADLGAGQ